jgi:hypothetical protein
MSTVTAIDYRRSDLRKNVLENPYWITSAEVNGVASEDLAAILFSFPHAGRLTMVHEVIIQVTEGFTVGAGAALCTVGMGTIATDDITTGGVVTDVDADAFILTASITVATAGYYMPLSASTSTWLTSQKGGTITNVVGQFIVGAATAVPVVCAYISNAGGAITAGKIRAHFLISELPGK